jgi:phage shock protein E
MGILRNIFTSLAPTGAPHRVPPEEAWRRVEEGAVLVDVRTTAEFDEEHLDGARNIPLHEIGERANELDAGVPLVVYCRSGGRSATAARILTRIGFDVVDGGGIGTMQEGR